MRAELGVGVAAGGAMAVGVALAGLVAQAGAERVTGGASLALGEQAVQIDRIRKKPVKDRRLSFVMGRGVEPSAGLVAGKTSGESLDSTTPANLERNSPTVLMK